MGARDAVIELRQVQVADYIPQIADLLHAHWTEMRLDFPLDVSVEMYREMQDAGVLFGVFAFEGDRPIGYSTATITPHPFNPAVIFCSSDAIFVAPEYRNGTTGYRLIVETERIGKERGARFMSWHPLAGTPLADVLDESRGYKLGDVCKIKEL